MYTRSMAKRDRELALRSQQEANQHEAEQYEEDSAAMSLDASSSEEPLPTASFVNNEFFREGHYQAVYLQAAETDEKKALVRLMNSDADQSVDYTISALAGGGTYGVVYKFSHDGHDIAVKTPNEKWSPIYMSNELDIKNEFYFLRKAYPNEGPYTLQHMFKEKAKSTLYSYRMIMPFIPGQSIKAILNESKQPELTALLFLRIAEELHRLHTHDIIHGDIRPGNILVERCEENDFKIHFIDFDFAYHVHGKATAISDIDRFGFYAPERQYGRAPLANPAQDIHALARTLEWVLNASNLSENQLHELYEKFPEIESFIIDGLSRTPSKRPTLSKFVSVVGENYNKVVQKKMKATSKNKSRKLNDSSKFKLFSPYPDEHAHVENMSILNKNTYSTTKYYKV